VIYPTLKQIVSFISAQKEFGFKCVVLVEYPGKGLWSLGFLTNEGFKNINDAMGTEMAAVYISTVPGPLAGNLVFVPKGQIRFPEITIVEALKIIISGAWSIPQPSCSIKSLKGGLIYVGFYC